MTTATAPVTVTGKPVRLGGFKRYRLSNGWFIDGATRTSLYYQGHKYSVWEPGASPSGCAAFRGGGPTLALAVAVANGHQLCGKAEFGCRNTAIGYRLVTVQGREYRSYHCEDHAPLERAPMSNTPTYQHPDGQDGAGWYDITDETVKPLGRNFTPAQRHRQAVPNSETTCTRCGANIVLVAHRVGGTGEYALAESPYWWTCQPTPERPVQQHEPAKFVRRIRNG